jgi:hypothetical protein
VLPETYDPENPSPQMYSDFDSRRNEVPENILRARKKNKRRKWLLLIDIGLIAATAFFVYKIFPHQASFNVINNTRFSVKAYSSSSGFAGNSSGNGVFSFVQEGELFFTVELDISPIQERDFVPASYKLVFSLGEKKYEPSESLNLMKKKDEKLFFYLPFDLKNDIIRISLEDRRTTEKVKLTAFSSGINKK